LGCVNPDTGPLVRRICEVGCGLCAKKNPARNGGIRLKDGLPVVIYGNLTSWHEANSICPRKCYVTREGSSVHD